MPPSPVRPAILPGPRRARLAVAGLSARLMAQSAQRGGYEVVALDAFGDHDTRQAASAWHDIGIPPDLRLDGPRLLAALRAHQPLLGWIAGSGFEAMPELLAEGARLLPLLGTPAAAVDALRSPDRFFACLAAAKVPHPTTQLQPPVANAGWLVKDLGSSGGTHVRPAGQPGPPAHRPYYQQAAPGQAMSTLFIANASRACIVGHQLQTVAPLGACPYAWHGVIGPVPLPADAQACVEHALAVLVPHFGVRGLASLDYLLDGSLLQVLELNPRPSASMALYDAPGRPSLIDAHVQACLYGTLPAGIAPVMPLRGTRTVFAARAGRMAAAALARLQQMPWCHDVASQPQALAPHAPVCTVSAQAHTVGQVQRQLEARVDDVLHGLGNLETLR